jgi:hypothetical protein
MIESAAVYKLGNMTLAPGEVAIIDAQTMWSKPDAPAPTSASSPHNDKALFPCSRRATYMIYVTHRIWPLLALYTSNP